MAPRRTKRKPAARRPAARPAPAGVPPPAVAAPAKGVQMTLAPGRAAATASRRGLRVVLENADPAIPLDRVPYFVSDLIRLGVVAGIMVALLVVSALVIIPRLT